MMKFKLAMNDKLWVIKLTTSNGQDCFLVNGNHGDPARSHNVDNAAVFPTEIDAVKRSLRLGKMYPNREFTVSSITVRGEVKV